LCIATAGLSAARHQSAAESDEVCEAEKGLADLGYWTGPVDGKLDPVSRHAVIAFQKLEGLKRTGNLDPSDIEAIRVARPPAPRETGYIHVEVDLTHQVLFIVDGADKVTGILPVSSGSGKLFTEGGWTRPAITPVGRFTIQRKIAGWRKSPLGLLYFPNYIIDGVAIHGNPSVPVYPASHGCIRIPMFAAREFSRATPLGMVVLVYKAAAEEDPPEAP
jgi:peptidoglycan hydrolase-like protein with peptidoglycan-binding domain